MRTRQESGLTFNFWLWACDTGDVSTESRAWEGNWFGKEGKLYGGCVELELSIGIEGQEMCSLGQVTQPLWASFLLLLLFLILLLPTICVAEDSQWNKTYTMQRIVLGT